MCGGGGGGCQGFLLNGFGMPITPSGNVEAATGNVSLEFIM